MFGNEPPHRMDMSTNSKFILVKWEGVRTEEGIGSHVIKDLSGYLVGKNHVIYTFIPTLVGFAGRYCLKDSLPLNAIIPSSIDCSLLGL
jgi:hypothetical protein